MGVEISSKEGKLFLLLNNPSINERLRGPYFAG